MGRFYVAIAGNIGAGKSSLTTLLSDRLGWEPFYESVSDNPYLEDFYTEMRRYAFHSQVFFLARRLQHHHRLIDFPGSVVQDRSIYEDAEIFASALYQQGHINERDFRTYWELYEVLVSLLPPPNLVVYLRASLATLQGRIAQRGRAFEQRIPPDYLALLNGLYERWMASFTHCPVLTIPADDLDFVHSSAHLDFVVDRLAERLGGKQLVLF